MHWRRKWQPTPVFLPGESQGQGSLVGCRLWGHTELDTTEATEQQQSHVHDKKDLIISKGPRSQENIINDHMNQGQHFGQALYFWCCCLLAWCECSVAPRFVIAFLPRSKCLFITWLQSPSAVILESKKIRSFTVSIVFPSICHEVIGPILCHDLSFLNVKF